MLDLDRDLTADELRTVFRTVTLRYHSDRHVPAGAAERAHLKTLLVRAEAAYELLLLTDPDTLH